MTDDALRDKDAEFERLEKEIDSLIAMTKHNAQILRKLDREIAASLRAAQTAPDSGVVVEAAEHTIGELQKSIRNIAYWIEHGKSETAAKEIRRIMDAGWMATGLRYRPKPKSEPAKQRRKRAKKIAKGAQA